jgi:acetylornithine/N-succinyldiaminopimelate aminotransferase
MNKDIPKSFARTGPHPMSMEIVAAKGSILVDSEGKEYIDLISGIAVNNFGHQHPDIVRAIRTQAERYAHVMVYGEYAQAIQLEVTEKLASLLPDGLDVCYFVNSGTESIEASIKLAKRYTGRNKICSFSGAYHGSTNGSLSISDNEYRKSAFRPLMPDVHFLELNNSEQLNWIDKDTAAVFLETIQGDAGVRIPDQAWVKALRARCNEVGALLVFDEIQCGIGRTGKFFAFEHYDIQPDILCLGKALGGGIPIGVFVSSEEIMSSLQNDPALGHITTFGGNPIACAAASKVLDLLQEPELMEHVEQKGKWIAEQLFLPAVKEIRQIGMMLAVDLSSSEEVDQVIAYCLEQGVCLFRFLSHPYSFRVAPPLNIEQEHLDLGIAVVRNALNKLR